MDDLTDTPKMQKEAVLPPLDVTRADQENSRRNPPNCTGLRDGVQITFSANAVIVSRERELIEALTKLAARDEELAVLSTAFHEVLCEFHTDDATFQNAKKHYLAQAMAENKLIESMLPHMMEIAGMVAALPVATEGEKERCEGCMFFLPNHADNCFRRGDCAATRVTQPKVDGGEAQVESAHDTERITNSSQSPVAAQSWNPALSRQSESGLFRISRWLPSQSGGWFWLRLKMMLLLYGVAAELGSLVARISFQYKLATLGGACGLGPLVERDHNGVLQPCKRTLACIRDTQSFAVSHPKATAYDRMIYQDAWLAGTIYGERTSDSDTTDRT